MNIETASKNVRTTYEAVNADAIPDQQNEEYVEYGVLTEGVSDADSANVGTMDKAVKSPAVLYQQNKSYVEAELLPEISSGADFANVGTMDKSIADTAFSGQHNEEDTEDALLSFVFFLSEPRIFRRNRHAWKNWRCIVHHVKSKRNTGK